VPSRERQQTGYSIDLRVVRDGEECIAFLRKTGEFHDAPTPQLLLLDLHMPRMNGLEVLEAINADKTIRAVPVVVLTTSDNTADVKAAYAWRCSGYVVKPLGYTQFVALIDSVLSYWLALVVLPRPLPD
jgi:CheY-like chemotaxis protein